MYLRPAGKLMGIGILILPRISSGSFDHRPTRSRNFFYHHGVLKCCCRIRGCIFKCFRPPDRLFEDDCRRGDARWCCKKSMLLLRKYCLYYMRTWDRVVLLLILCNIIICQCIIISHTFMSSYTDIVTQT